VAIGWQFLICCLRQVLKILEGMGGRVVEGTGLEKRTPLSFWSPALIPLPLWGAFFSPPLFIVTERLGFFRLQFRLQS
jgi:hypothetical protein